MSSSEAHADDDPASQLRLSYEAPSGCPSRHDFGASLSPRIQASWIDGADTRSFEIRIDREDRTFAGQLAHVRRRVQRRYEVVDDERVQAEADASRTPEQTLEGAQARAVLQTILDTMPEELRAVLVLFELERLTVPEISEMIGVLQGTVASRLRRAREMFMSRGPRIVRGAR